ncbi:hypothetical protein [Neorhizobium tomejilense]|uniref:hypothetical protein n=1 Tax=Neorhizobium tomejilense TaxID=2093828 RepID=UPI000CF88E86|nr:hypothetical protein [Neorhizobium tomejilense]
MLHISFAPGRLGGSLGCLLSPSRAMLAKWARKRSTLCPHDLEDAIKLITRCNVQTIVARSRKP